MPRRLGGIHQLLIEYRVYSTSSFARKWSTLGIGSVTKEGLFDSERFPLVAGMRRCLRGGGSGGGWRADAKRCIGEDWIIVISGLQYSRPRV